MQESFQVKCSMKDALLKRIGARKIGFPIGHGWKNGGVALRKLYSRVKSDILKGAQRKRLLRKFLLFGELSQEEKRRRKHNSVILPLGEVSPMIGESEPKGP